MIRDNSTNSLGRVEREAIRVLRQTVDKIESFEGEVHADGHGTSLFAVGVTLEGFFPCAVEVLAVSLGAVFCRSRLTPFLGLVGVLSFRGLTILWIEYRELLQMDPTF